jgi:hypothetical protein
MRDCDLYATHTPPRKSHDDAAVPLHGRVVLLTGARYRKRPSTIDPPTTRSETPFPQAEVPQNLITKST